ncbi:MAG: right-handed parallel beta-helix repeat-containing protein, partial [Planctomycetota bacterium]|nr:right-handed parallel beta-helix repeat-containing protein [Planctomycetota bacterium]
EITGFHFFACTFTLEDAEHCRVDHCNLLFPSFARGVPDAEKPRRICAGTRVTGKDNIVRNCSLAYCATFGIQARGQRNSIENCLIHDVNWSGTLRYTGISLSGNRNDEGPANAARYNTVYNVGNTIINSGGNRHGIIEYNHVHHGGMLSKDVSLIYTSMHYAMGNEIRYNWVHDSLSPSNSLGIRGDDKTRGLRIHHNVVWNVRRDGIVIKGGKNRVYNNTCFANGASDILFFSGREPDKWWQKHVKAYAHQNEDSLLINNCANVIVSTRRKRDPGLPGDHSNNDTNGAPKLAAPGKLDFRPGPDSPLVDAGRIVEGVTAPFVGKAPDVGAYERGGDHWLPGHRNGITLSRSAAGRLQGSLWMPVLEPVGLKIIKGEQAIGELTFTPGNWMEAQPIDLGALSPDENPQAIRFESGDWGSAAFADVRAVAPLKAMRAQFDRPDLSSARFSVPQFQYHEVYQPPETKKPVARAFRTKNPFRIDGQINDEGWPLLAPERYLPFVSLRTKPDKTFPPAGKAAILFDDENLYVGFHVPCPDLSKLKKTGGDWGTDDGVEVDLCALVKKKPGQIFVLHGFPSGAFESVTDAGASAEQAARLGAGLEYRCAMGDGEWTAEFRVPFKSLGVSLADLDYMRFNVGARRNGIEGGPWFAWERTGGANYEVDSGGLLLFHPEVMAESKNLLTNGSFESSKIAAWCLSSNSRKPIPTETAVRVREGRDGSWCIRLECHDENVMKERVFKWTHPFAAALAPGSYHLSYDVRVQQMTPRGKMGSFNSYIHARRNNRPGGNIGQTESMFEAAEMDWTRRDFILVLPAGVEGSMVSLQLHRTTGTVWIDNVSLLRCSKH